MNVVKVGVVGGGTMGQDIAVLSAREGLQKGFCVVVKEANRERADRVLANVRKRFDGWVGAGKINSGQAENLKSLVEVTDTWNGFEDADLLIEAVDERMDLKRQIFVEAEGCLPERAIFASNTSAIPITDMSDILRRPGRLVGMHFFNPPTRMPLVEMTPGNKTDPAVLAAATEFVREKLGKTVVTLKKECPGFIVNRMLVPYLNEAMLFLMNSTLTPEEIDREATNFGWPMGPFQLLDDVIGIDTAAKVAEVMRQSYGERAEMPAVLKKMVELGRFGKKTGAGFYGDPPITEVIQQNFPFARQISLPASDAFQQMMMGFVNEAFHCLEEGIAAEGDIETACVYGIGFPPARMGPLHWAEGAGLDKVLAALRKFQVYGARFTPSALLVELVEQKKPLFTNAGW